MYVHENVEMSIMCTHIQVQKKPRGKWGERVGGMGYLGEGITRLAQPPSRTAYPVDNKPAPTYKFIWGKERQGSHFVLDTGTDM